MCVRLSLRCITIVRYELWVFGAHKVELIQSVQASVYSHFGASGFTIANCTWNFENAVVNVHYRNHE